ncbi:MAG: cell division protein FtsW [Planctomycetota bacterium]|nr:MAG: cell division protein FtsW [Planctomycetota bacterium]
MTAALAAGNSGSRAQARARATGAGQPRPAPSRPGAEPGTELLAVALALLALGLIMVFSTSAIEADRRFGDATLFLRRQVVWAAVALLGLMIARTTDYRWLVRLRTPALLVLLGLLVAVLFEPERKGARRWIHLGSLQFQPSELAKLVVPVWIAGACAQLRARAAAIALGDTLRVVGAIGAVVVLIAVEPDFGTALFIAAISGVLLLAGGIPFSHLVLIAVPAALAGLGYALARLEHVRARLAAFLDPASMALEGGYQAHQSLIALGSGGPWGLGLGRSLQKLYFLPDDHTDFILAIVGEELGLVGTLGVLALFAALVWLGSRIARQAPDAEGALVALGLTAALGLQAAMNIAVVTASMPTKGISLPFVSYGGSALLVAMVAVGILMNIAGAGARKQLWTRGPAGRG